MKHSCSLRGVSFADAAGALILFFAGGHSALLPRGGILCLRRLLRVVLVVTMAGSSASAQVYEKVFSFTDASEATFASASGLTLGSDGNYYGTSGSGGSYGLGAIYKVTPAGVASTLVSFNGTDGASPTPGLVQYSDGSFYGTTTGGGANNAGTIFKVTPGGALTVVYSLGSGTSTNSINSVSGLVLGNDNNFYGVTEYGGSNFYSVTPSGVFTPLGNVGFEPVAALTKGTDGNFYGTTYGNTVFEVTPAGAVTTLHTFNGSDGANLYGSVVQGNDGFFYGVTRNGGSSGDGTIFKVDAQGNFVSLVNFTGANGAHPYGKLALGIDGNFYGVTFNGGTSMALDPLGFGYGTVFKVTPSGVLTTLVNFDGTNGGKPVIGLTPSLDGNFVGTTQFGTTYANGSGTLFEITPAGVLTTLASFPESAGTNPGGGVVQGGDGNFYGTTSYGPGNDGTIFKITPSGSLTTLASFAFPSEGAYPGQLTLGHDGNFYGPTVAGGSSYVDNGFSGYGTFFEMTPGGTLSTLVNLNGSAGSNFQAGNNNKTRAALIQDGQGNFYGMTEYGGSFGYGNIFEITTAGAMTTLVSFDNASLGGYPQGSLVLAKDGNFYGTTSSGGTSGDGTIFQMTSSGTLTTLVNFSGTNGSAPVAGLIQASDDALYGTTSSGGTSGDGTLFKVTTTGSLTTLVNFNGTNGSAPSAALLLASDGNFYGTTSTGGAGIYGTIFQMTPAGGLTTLYDFANDPADSNPQAPLVQATDGNLYGTTYGQNGLSNMGVGDGAIYRIIFPGTPNVYPYAPSEIGTNSAVFTLQANARNSATTVTLEYGTASNSLGNSVPIATSLTGNQTTLMGATLTGLTPGTTYYYQIVATNSSGTTTTPVASFSTYEAPTAVTSATTNVLPTSVQLNGTVNAVNYSTSVVFQYGTDPYFSAALTTSVVATPGTITGNTDTLVNAAVAGLAQGTTYYYRVSATSVGGTTFSGVGTFTTPTNPAVTATAASFVGSQSALLNGTVTAMGAPTTVTFVYGTVDGSGNFTPEGTVGATPGTVSGSAPVAVSASISSTVSVPLAQGGTYYYEVVATGAGLTSTSALVPFNLSILSDTSLRRFPGAPPAAQGGVQVNLTPAATSTFTPGWRLQGEQLWRASGAPVQDLVAGDYTIEYRPAPGYLQPPPELISVTSGNTTTLNREYYATSGGPVGGLQIVLAPAGISGAQWRFLGQDNTQWKASGVSVTGLSPGNYLVECKPVMGQTTPPPSSVTVTSGITTTINLTYFTASPAQGAQPAALTFGQITNSNTPTLPYAFVGQIRSDVGSATGFVVEDRVVATAGHVVFDDGTFSYVTGLQWLFQREAGTYEPVPQVPRGFYVFDGYAAQREAENTPGVSSPASQNLDVAALYFLAEAGGGGASGYLASDAFTNEFLLPLNQSTPTVTLVGYPVDGIAANQQGQMFATPATTATFTQDFDSNGNPYQVYTTSSLSSAGGNSGGPLCVLNTDGNYYPAAIYLGGSAQTVVRSIDSTVIDLFTRAETSGNGGANHTGGGITQVSTTILADSLLISGVTVNFASGSPTGAGWSLAPTDPPLVGGTTLDSLTPGNYTIYAAPVPGYVTPAPLAVALTGGQVNSYLVTYTDLFGGTATGTANLNFSPWFGYYSNSAYPLVYEYNLGYEYVFAAGSGVYLYDYASGHFWYTQSTYFPFIYDFSLRTYLYYYNNNTPHRHFYNYATGVVISM